MKSLITTLTLTAAAFAVIAMNAAQAHAEDHRDLSSETAVAATAKVSKSEQIRAYAQNCFDQEMALFEQTKGRLPSDDEADFIIDACANPKLK
jgi:hypothetical protein